MKRRIPQRILSAFLALILLFSCVPTVYAAEAATEPLTVVEETEAPAVETAETLPEEPETEAPALTEPETVPAQETEAPEVTEPLETEAQATEPAETVPVEETEPLETVPEETEPAETVPEETVPEETVPQETVPVELPCGFAGLPEGYVLSEEDAALKQDMLDRKVLENLAGMTAGEDYAADYVIVSAEDEEEAALFAAAFSGELISFRHGMARVGLQTASVYEAVEASLVAEYNLPAAYPNYISGFEPIENVSALAAAALPEQQDWASWVRDNLSNPDPALLYPGEQNYQWMHDTIGSYAAWGVTTGASWVKVAVIDTGVNTSHTELSGHISSINIGLGTSDAADHGTHVAGIIAGALDNGSGGAGVAPGVSIINIRAYDANEGGFLDDDIAAAIDAAVEAGAHVINMSLGGPGYNWFVQNAINNAVSRGVTVIAATGNVGSNTIAYPAAYDNVIAVAASSRDNTRAHFSNYGPWTDISAPGDDIYSSVNSGDYAVYDGTSMAAPVVAGVAALYTSAMGQRVDPAVMEKALESSATKMKDSGCGAGIVNIANMLDGVPAAPYYVITDGSRTYKATEPIPCDAKVYFFESEAAYYNNEGDVNSQMICTVDGKAPSVKNGELIYGTALEDPISLKLSSFAGSKVTVKVARMSGMGIMGKVLTLNLNVVGDDNINSITIRGASKLMPGKSCIYAAEVNPVATANQAVTWEITSSTVSGAKINAKTGALTTPAGKTGTITIRAKSVEDPSVTAYKTVTVASMAAVSSITLSKTSVTLFVGDTGSVSVSRMVDVNGNSVSTTRSGVRWTSSNTKVLTVDANGNYEAKAKGSATITCLSLDGSNKKATCKVTVQQQVETITITGQGSIAPGTSATYKATVTPTTANNKKVTWALYNAPSGVSIDAKTGKVTVQSWATTEKSFYVRAYAADGWGTYASYRVVIRGKCTSMYIGKAAYSGLAAKVVYSGKAVKTVNLFSYDLDSSSGADNKATLSCYAASPSDYMCFSWKSSAPHIASVDPSTGVVTAHKAGTATITLTAEDGSGKKATCTVKVTNPVSYISIASSSVAMTSGKLFLGAGKSVSNTAVFANTYGKPTNQKVNWSYNVYELNSDGSIYATRTSAFKSLVTLSNSGKLAVKPAAAQKWLNYNGPIMIRVYATATDGTGAQAYVDYMMSPATTVVRPQYTSYRVPAGRLGTVYFYSDQWPGAGFGFNVTSSNPKVVSVHEDSTQANITYVGTQYGLYKYALYLVMPGSTGSATVTIKAADGSNKGCSFSVSVY